MASRTWAWWGALALALSFSAGCDGEKGNRFPPPQPYPGGPIVKPGGSGDAGGGAGGAAGGGGAAGSGGAPVLNVCECAFGMIDTAACGSCVNDALAPGGSCESFEATCKASMACDELFHCKDECVAQPAVEQVPCIQACYGKVDLGSPDNHDFVNLMGCLCDKCASKCVPSSPIACE